MKSIIKLTPIFLILLLITGCNSSKLNEYSKNMFYMDTYINVKIYTENEKKADKAFEEVEKIYSDYHTLTNAYDDKSTLSMLNNNNSNEEYIEIDEALFEMLKLSYEWLDKSNGYFNVNIGNLTKFWKKHKELETLPNQDDLDKINIYDFEIKDNKIKNENLYFDLGGISKGYATEIVAEKLEKLNIKNYLINAGGNVRAGKAYNKDYFSIGIENPNLKNDVYQIIKGNNLSVVTSGGYERFFEIDGYRYHHIIDPNTKYPSANMLSATVITKDSKIADILSTTIFLMNKEEALELIESLDGVECILFISEDEIIKSSGFNQYE